MTILESFKKWASRWGTEIRGDNIAEVISDFADNLPFGTKTEMVEIVPEQSVTVQELNEFGIGFVEATYPELIEGNKYIVYFNGKKYECIAKKVKMAGVYIGSEYIYTGEGLNDCPFAFSDGVLAVEEVGKYTFTFYEEQTVVNPINQMFIPNIAYFKSQGFDEALTGVAVAEAQVVSYSCVNMTYEQAIAHLMSGKPLIGVMQWFDNGVYTILCPYIVYDGGKIVIAGMGDNYFYWTVDGIEQQ